MSTLVPGPALSAPALDLVTPRLACRQMHATVASTVTDVLARPARALGGSAPPGRSARTILPDNLAPLVPRELAWAVEVSAAGAFGLAWAPAIDVVRAVLACRTASERDDVLLDRADDVLDDCLGALRAPEVDVPVDTLVPVRLAQRAVEAAQAGCVEAAHALATHVLDTTFADGRLTCLAHDALRDVARPRDPDAALRRWRFVLAACALPSAEELYGGSAAAAVSRLPPDPFGQRRLEAVKVLMTTTSWVRLLSALAAEAGDPRAPRSQAGGPGAGRPRRNPWA